MQHQHQTIILPVNVHLDNSPDMDVFYSHKSIVGLSIHQLQVVQFCVSNCRYFSSTRTLWVALKQRQLLVAGNLEGIPSSPFIIPRTNSTRRIMPLRFLNIFPCLQLYRFSACNCPFRCGQVLYFFLLQQLQH